MGIFIIVVAVIIILLVYGISVYNKLIRYRNQSEEASAAIDAHLKRRYDLVPNLVETVKGYAAHEKETFSAVIAARNAAMGAQTLEEKDEATKIQLNAEEPVRCRRSISRIESEYKFHGSPETIAGHRKGIAGSAYLLQCGHQTPQYDDRSISFKHHCVDVPFHQIPYLSIEEEAKQNVHVSF